MLAIKNTYKPQHSFTNLHSEGVLISARLELAMLCNWSDLPNHSVDIPKTHTWAVATETLSLKFAPC